MENKSLTHLNFSEDRAKLHYFFQQFSLLNPRPRMYPSLGLQSQQSASNFRRAPKGQACDVLSCFSSVWLFVTPWTVAHEAPLSMGFSRQEYWSGPPFPFPKDIPHRGIEPALAGRLFTTRATSYWGFPLFSKSPFSLGLLVTLQQVMCWSCKCLQVLLFRELFLSECTSQEWDSCHPKDESVVPLPYSTVFIRCHTLS